jgi:hypothetical protein
VSKNKYRGRELKTSDFPRVLKAFLSDGDTLLIDHIPIIIRKLHRLAAIMLSLKGFRFYGCSLLLIYDGDASVQQHYSRHVRSHATIYEEDHERPDAHHRRRSVSRPGDTRRSRSAEVGSASPAHSKHRKVRGEVNIRVVDFAHTTTGKDFVPIPKGSEDVEGMGKGYETRFDEETGLAMARFPPKHGDKPDMGFLFGLKSVCETLEEIWVDAMRGRDGEAAKWWHEGEEGLKRVFERAFPDGVEDAELST